MLVKFWLQLGSLAVSPASVANIQPRSLADQIVKVAIGFCEPLQTPDSRLKSELPACLTLGHMVH